MSEALDNYFLPIIVIACAIALPTLILLLTKNKKIALLRRREAYLHDEIHSENAERVSTSSQPTNDGRTIPSSQAEKAKEELRILGLEKEITGYALTRLYEAEVEGKITKEDQARLLEKYKAEMREINKEIRRKEMIVKLYELEGAQSELVDMFNKKLEEIKEEIGKIRSSLGLIPREETSGEEVKPPDKRRESVKKPRLEKNPPKTEAEQKLEAIQEEVLKVLERLEKIEAEA